MQNPSAITGRQMRFDVPLLLLLSLLSGCSSHQEPSTPPLFEIIKRANYKPASTDEAFQELIRADPKRVPIIRSAQDWAQYILHRSTKRHPLHALSAKELNEFTRGLVFNNGLAGANLVPLEENLTVNAFSEVLGAFGLDIGYYADHVGYECEKRGTCKEIKGYICTSNC